ncbi:MAG: hypothetical protein FRX49_03056 [Trebouxia sp. A1-2]|nr:MAG: hypothetical protein FRX49_03056 [Trebouxia sp. A1-2]
MTQCGKAIGDTRLTRWGWWSFAARGRWRGRPLGSPWWGRGRWWATFPAWWWRGRALSPTWRGWRRRGLPKGKSNFLAGTCNSCATRASSEKVGSKGLKAKGQSRKRKKVSTETSVRLLGDRGEPVALEAGDVCWCISKRSSEVAGNNQIGTVKPHS